MVPGPEKTRPEILTSHTLVEVRRKEAKVEAERLLPGSGNKAVEAEPQSLSGFTRHSFTPLVFPNCWFWLQSQTTGQSK